MPGIPVIHLHTRSPSPRPLPPSSVTLAPEPEPLSAPPPQLKRQKSILKKMSIPITWGEPVTPDQHHKLHKKPPKNVHFTPPPSATSDKAIDPADADYPPDETLETGLPTPDTTPVADEKKAKKGIVSRLFPSNKAIVLPPSPPRSPHDVPQTDVSENFNDTPDPWHHHASYFPEYEAIHLAPTAIAGMPGVINHSAYFPDYTPIFHASHPVNAYPNASGALAYALSTPEAQAAAHAQRVGHSIAVHYPDLPRFAEYQSASAGKGGSTWQSGQWGVEGWTGFGWVGEKLPNADGQTFGAPMPKGVPLPKESDKKKDKDKKEKEGDGEGEKEGGEEEEDKAAVEGAEGGAAGEGGEAGGSSKKKKNKKKK